MTYKYVLELYITLMKLSPSTVLEYCNALEMWYYYGGLDGGPGFKMAVSSVHVT